MLLIIFICMFYFLIHTSAYGQTTTSINETIKISVCGNSVAEGGEDCDGTDLHAKTCTMLGYGGGILNCDISCSYDTSACIAATPSPTPMLTPATTSLLPTQTPGSSAQPTIEVPTDIPTSQPIQSIPIEPQSKLPEALRPFDLKGNGKIDTSELHTVLALWVNGWKQSLKSNSQTNTQVCDINRNGKCELHDFSILLSYVGK